MPDFSNNIVDLERLLIKLTSSKKLTEIVEIYKKIHQMHFQI